MLELDGRFSGHDDELAIPTRGHAVHYRKRRAFTAVHGFVLLVLVPFLTFFILYLQWDSAFWAPEATSPELLDATPSAEPQRDLKNLLRPEDHVSRDPLVRQFSWTITKATIAPDGVKKNVFLINDQFPGPTIEARSGDVLEIEVINLSAEAVSIHWHGLDMRGANEMDGPVGITQCAIEADSKFTYRVPINDQVGTFWYHAHSEVQRGDGLYGGLVIHNPSSPEKASYQYEHELLFLIGDWYHWPAQKVLETFMSRTGGGDEPNPDSLLVNGLGYFECSMATHGAPVDCSEIGKPRLTLNKQHRYRIRVVNVGSLTGFFFSIPDAEMNVIQVDGGYPIDSHLANSVGVLYPGERVDFVASWSELVVNTDTKITIELDKEYFLRPNFALTPTQSFLLSAESRTPQPTNTTTEIIRFNLREAKGPQISSLLPEPEKVFMVYTAIEILNHLNNVPKGFINRTTWEPQSLPLISMDRESWNDHQLVPWTGAESAWVELTINNVDATGHPFHLHGHGFYVVASYEGNGGWDYYNPFNPSKPPVGGSFNLLNPVQKDTVYVPPWGYVVIRFLADNEGIWALHCHVLWHATSGMSMAFQVLGDEHKGLSGSGMGVNAKQLCGT